MSSSTTCAICLDEMGLRSNSETETVSPQHESIPPKNSYISFLASCTHYFHEKCINQWSETSNTCPTCRAKFNSVTIRGSIEGDFVKSYAVEDSNARSTFIQDDLLDLSTALETSAALNFDVLDGVGIFSGSLMSWIDEHLVVDRPSLQPHPEGTLNEVEQVSRVLMRRTWGSDTVNRTTPTQNEDHSIDNQPTPINTECYVCDQPINTLGAVCSDCFNFTHFSCVSVSTHGSLTTCPVCGLTNFICDSQGNINTFGILTQHVNNRIYETALYERRQNELAGRHLPESVISRSYLVDVAGTLASMIYRGRNDTFVNVRPIDPVQTTRQINSITQESPQSGRRIMGAILDGTNEYRDEGLYPRSAMWMRISRDNISRMDLTSSAFEADFGSQEQISSTMMGFGAGESEDEDALMTGEDEHGASEDEEFVETSHYSNTRSRLQISSSFHRERDYSGESLDFPSPSLSSSRENTIILRAAHNYRSSPLASNVVTAQESDLDDQEPKEAGEGEVAAGQENQAELVRDEVSESWNLFELAETEQSNSLQSPSSAQPLPAIDRNTIRFSNLNQTPESVSRNGQNTHAEGSNTRKQKRPLRRMNLPRSPQPGLSSSTETRQDPISETVEKSQTVHETSQDCLQKYPHESLQKPIHEHASQTTVQSLLNSIRNPEPSSNTSPNLGLSPFVPTTTGPNKNSSNSLTSSSSLVSLNGESSPVSFPSSSSISQPVSPSSKSSETLIEKLSSSSSSSSETLMETGIQFCLQKETQGCGKGKVWAQNNNNKDKNNGHAAELNSDVCLESENLINTTLDSTSLHDTDILSNPQLDDDDAETKMQKGSSIRNKGKGAEKRVLQIKLSKDNKVSKTNGSKDAEGGCKQIMLKTKNGLLDELVLNDQNQNQSGVNRDTNVNSNAGINTNENKNIDMNIPAQRTEKSTKYILSKASKAHLQNLVRDILRPLFRSGQLSNSEYTTINQKASRRLYKDVIGEIKRRPGLFEEDVVESGTDEYLDNFKKLRELDNGDNSRDHARQIVLVSVKFTEPRIARWKHFATKRVDQERAAWKKTR